MQPQVTRVFLAAVQIWSACAVRLVPHAPISSHVEQLDQIIGAAPRSLGPDVASPDLSQCDGELDADMFVRGVASYRVPRASPMPAQRLERRANRQGANKRIALALRGESFRSGSSNSGFHLSEGAYTCSDHTYKVQYGIWKSHKINVIDILEREGYEVDTYVFTKPCYNGKKYHQDLMRWYKPKRFTLLNNATFAHKGRQGIYDPTFKGEFWQSAFAEHLLESINHPEYESIFMVRLDQMFVDTPITDMMMATSGKNGLHFPQRGEIYGTENLQWFHSLDKAKVRRQIREGCVSRGFGDCENFGLHDLPLEITNVQAYYDGSSLFWKCPMQGTISSTEWQYFSDRGFDGSLARLWITRPFGTSCCNASSTVLSFGKFIA